MSVMTLPADSLRPEGDDILTCRVAGLSQDFRRVDLVFHCEDGAADLEVRDSSKALRPYLCPISVHSMIEYDASTETQLRSPMRGNLSPEPMPPHPREPVSDKKNRRRTYGLPTLQGTVRP
jgi:hypothetical protein